MRILLTNDDGINAPGLVALRKIAALLGGEVITVAPETNQSGAGHSLTLRRPLRVREVEDQVYAVDGTPTDCVLVGLRHLLKDKDVDLVLSGVNHGRNLAEDVTYSGTIAAAMEASLCGVRAIALSQSFDRATPIRWDTAIDRAPGLIAKLIALNPQPRIIHNVNFPDVSPEEVRGVRVTAQGRHLQGEPLEEHIDPRGEPYVWIGLPRTNLPQSEDSDIAAIAEGYVSVTPISLDMTDRSSFKDLRKALN